jgi:SOS-response transcriptional repressor LexA
MDLTTREKQTLEAIRELSKDGFPPTIAAVKQAIGIRSQDMAVKLLASLRRKGLLLTWPGRRQNAILLAPEPMRAAA